MLDNSPTAGEFLKLLALAERLGWLAVVLPLNHIEVKEEHSNVFKLEFEQALNQASGLPKKRPPWRRRAKDQSKNQVRIKSLIT